MGVCIIKLCVFWLDLMRMLSKSHLNFVFFVTISSSPKCLVTGIRRDEKKDGRTEGRKEGRKGRKESQALDRLNWTFCNLPRRGY